MWYYEFAHRPVGPVDTETIKQLLANGNINAATLVWSEGMPSWLPLQQTELAHIWESVSQNMPQPAMQMPVAYVQPNHSVKSSVLKNLFVWWLVLESLTFAYLVFNYFLPTGSIKTAISCGFEIPIMAASVLLFVLLFKFWQVVQDRFARTTPAKAIGFLFIPFFNIYWNFVAIFGLSKELNRFSRQHLEFKPIAQVNKSHPLFALFSVIASYLFTGYLFYYMIHAFSLVFANQRNPGVYNNAIKSMTLPMAIISLVSVLIQIILIIDLYRAASSILTSEEAHQA